MDFELTEELQALTGLAGTILADLCDHQRLASLEADAKKNARGGAAIGHSGSVHDAAAWKALADAGVFGAVLPEADDGGDLGALGVALLAELTGKHAAYLPMVATLALGALPLARYGAGASLAAVVAGEELLTAALEEPGEPTSLTTTARADGDGGYVVDGEKTFVPYGDLADRILVPAALGDRTVVLVVPRTAAGVTVTPLLATGRQPYADVELRGVRVSASEVLGTPEQGAEIVAWIRDLGSAAYAAEAAGACAEAVRMTAKYTSERRQFGEPIASFQAVGQRAADAYIDAEVMRLTMLHAAWLFDNEARGNHEAATRAQVASAVAIAKFHAGDAGSRVLHACQHLHGGIGVDMDYPLHRYFVRGQQIEQTLGTATRQLLVLGAQLAEH